MHIARYESETLFAEVGAEWNELLADSAADQVFLTYEWQKTWWEAYQPGDIWALAVRDENGRLQGLAPWFRRTEADGSRVIRPIGCVDVTDYLEVIARRECEAPVFQALADYLAEHSDECDQICICNVPEAAAMKELMPRLLEAQGFRVEMVQEDVCPIVTLPVQWADYVASLEKKQRRELRRKLRRASGSHEQVAWYIVGPEHQLDEEVTKFLHLMAASHEEKAEFLRDRHNETFFRAMVPKMAERGWLQLAFLTVNGKAAAAYLNFVYRRQVLVYNSGHDPAVHGHLSPGIVLLARLIERAIADRYEVFDFLRGDEAYKYNMGGRDTYVYRMVIHPPTAVREEEVKEV